MSESKLCLDPKSCLEFKSRRPKTMTRTINNNINIKGYSKGFGRRRNRGSRIKSTDYYSDVEMTAKEADRDEAPRLSPEMPEKVPRTKPERQYSRKELIELMTHPLSSIKHPCLESPQNKSLVSGRVSVRWLEDRWDHRKHTDSLTDEDRPDQPSDPQKKKMNDPKAERLRKEQDVVLSPQRRSFNSGCFVNLPPQHGNPVNRRPESPLKGDREQGHRELPARRIGSGRIMRDPVWDFRAAEKEEVAGQNINNHDFNFRQRDDRFERRTYERSHDKERVQRPRYTNDRRKYEKNEPEEPEWFSGGPTSQHDTIELHGFDGPVEEKISPSKKQNKNNKNNVKNNRKVSETISSKNENVQSGKKNSSRKSSPELPEQPRLSSSPVESKKSDSSEPTTKTSGANPDCVFDIEDILNFDSLPPLLSMSNGCVDEGSGSRFSQFFRKESPSPQKPQGHDESRHSSAHDQMFNSMINDITSTNITIPPDGDTYFAPISPAASSVKEEPNKGPSLLEMLQRGNHNQGFPGRKITKKPSLRDLEACGKIHSVEELETRLRQEQGLGKPVDYNQPRTKEEELQAFRKLIMNKHVQNMQEQKTSHGSVSGSFQNQQQQQQSQQQQQQSQQQQQQSQQQHGINQQQQQMPIPHDLVMKLLHVQQQQRQQEVFAKLLAPPSRLPAGQFSVPPPMPPLSPELQMHINNAQPSKELLQRPEAQTILRSLKRGEITVLHLVEQLKRNSTMQPVHREMIACIIKLHGMQSGVGVSQREPSPAGLAPPSGAEQLLHQMLHTQQSHHQQHQLRIPSPHSNTFGAPAVVSPNLPQNTTNTLTIQHPHPAFGAPAVVSPNLPQNTTNTLTIQRPHPVLQRVPSPRELVAHTQSILQNALLKKKLEEQKENFRKRQEMQRSHSPNISAAGSLSPANHQPSTTSPTPLAFTPTSVLRKMTADKESELSNKQQLHHQQQQQQQPDTSLQPPKQGRAIVKGNNNFSVPPPIVPQMDYSNMPPQYKVAQRSNPQQHFMMGMNRNNIQPPNARVRNMGGSNMMQPQQQGMNQSVQQLLMNQNYNSSQHRNNSLLKPEQGMVRSGRSYNYSCSETQDQVNNQLARWFSPELLAQAREGKLPHMPPLSPTQNMLSVEELERLQQAVHN